MTKDQAIEVLIAHAKRCPEPEPRERGYPEDIRDDYNEWRERQAKVAEAIAVLSVPVVEPPIAKFLKWSIERPTKSGSYWLSVHPNKRGSEWGVVEDVRVTAHGDGSSFVQRVRHNAICDRKDATDALFNDSQWALHELPSDPFEVNEAVGVLTSRPSETGASFARHLDHASALVRSWPGWKQHVLGSTATAPEDTHAKR